MSALKTRTVPALERGLAMLEILAEAGVGLTLPELVRRTGLAKSTAHCLLVTLERHGYLWRHEKTTRYLLGAKLLDLAPAALTGLKLRQAAAPFLRGLMERTWLTVHLAILDQNQIVIVSRYAPPGAPRVATWTGKRIDVHCSALGKSLLACLPDHELSRLIRECGLPRHNDNNPASRKKLDEEVARAAGLGYAIEDEEDQVGVRSVAASVLDANARAVASISISGTVQQVDSENISWLAAEVKTVSQDISRAITCAGIQRESLVSCF